MCLRYAAGATIQILLFGILAIEVKRKAPTAHTVLEIISKLLPARRCWLYKAQQAVCLAVRFLCLLLHGRMAAQRVQAVLLQSRVSCVSRTRQWASGCAGSQAWFMYCPLAKMSHQ